MDDGSRFADTSGRDTAGSGMLLLKSGRGGMDGFWVASWASAAWLRATEAMSPENAAAAAVANQSFLEAGKGSFPGFAP